MLKTQAQSLRDFMAKGRLDKAIEDLTKYAQSLSDQHYHNAVTQLSARCQTNERAHNLGTISNSEYTTERNKISHAILALVNELADDASKPLDNVTKENGSATVVPGNKVDFWKKVGYIGLILGILASMAKIIEFCSKPSDKEDGAMQLTVYVQGVDGKPIPELQNNGKIIVDFGNDRRAPLIGENGRTNLGETPEKFRGQEIPIVLQSTGYEPVLPAKQYVMDGEPVYFLAQRDNSLGIIQGIVKDRSGDKFIAGALVMIDSDTTIYTDSLGRFRVQLPPAKQRDTYYLTIKKADFKTKNDYFKPNTAPIEIRLDR